MEIALLMLGLSAPTPLPRTTYLDIIGTYEINSRAVSGKFTIWPSGSYSGNYNIWPGVITQTNGHWKIWGNRLVIWEYADTNEEGNLLEIELTGVIGKRTLTGFATMALPGNATGYCPPRPFRKVASSEVH